MGCSSGAAIIQRRGRSAISNGSDHGENLPCSSLAVLKDNWLDVNSAKRGFEKFAYVLRVGNNFFVENMCKHVSM
jgi:hypothetical protein